MKADAQMSSAGVGGGRVPCRQCGRNFAPDRIGIHEHACARAGRKRPVYDTAAHRMAGIDGDSGIPGFGSGGRALRSRGVSSSSRSGRRPASATSSAAGPAPWRRQHAELIRAVRSARGLRLPPLDDFAHGSYEATYLAGDGRVPCGHCGRRFAPDTAERHIPHCAVTMARPAPPPSTAYGYPSRPHTSGATPIRPTFTMHPSASSPSTHKLTGWRPASPGSDWSPHHRHSSGDAAGHLPRPMLQDALLAPCHGSPGRPATAMASASPSKYGSTGALIYSPVKIGGAVAGFRPSTASPRRPLSRPTSASSASPYKTYHAMTAAISPFRQTDFGPEAMHAAPSPFRPSSSSFPSSSSHLSPFSSVLPRGGSPLSSGSSARRPPVSFSSPATGAFSARGGQIIFSNITSASNPLAIGIR